MFQNGNNNGGNVSHRRNRIGHRHHRKRGNKRRLSECEEGNESDDLWEQQREESKPHPANSNRNGNRNGNRSPLIPLCDDFHREFVKSIFQIGIDQSSPAVIAEEMITKNSYNTPSSDLPEPLSFSERKVEGGTGRSCRARAPEYAGGREKDLTEYYKRELTGERLKSHLQKLRKQKDREIELFLEEHDSHLAKEKSIDRRKKELAERESKRREEAREHRRRLRKMRQRPPNLLEPVDWGIDVCDDQLDPSEASREEEERLLSLYLPLRVVGNDRNGNDDPEAEDDDEQGPKTLFPAGGKAIGKLTWAVQKDLQSWLKSKEDAAASRSDPLGADDGSVASATSHTAAAAGEVADALASDCHRNHKSQGRRKIIDCASSEDEDEDAVTDFDEKHFHDKDHHDAIPIPTLTEAEKNSPLGVSMRLTWDLIRYMHGVIAEDRTKPQQGERVFETNKFGDIHNNKINSCKNSKPKHAFLANLHTWSNPSTALSLDTGDSSWGFPQTGKQNNDNTQNPGCNLGVANRHLAATMDTIGPPPTAFMTTIAENVMTMINGTNGLGGLPTGATSNSFLPKSTATNVSSDQQTRPIEIHHTHSLVTTPIPERHLETLERHFRK
eukprot:jgi/Psemu1/288537/fgenesh1_pg.269_\